MRSSHFERLIIYSAALLTSLLPCTGLASRYSGGTGDPNDPYQIATAQDLIDLSITSFDHDRHFVLTADIDMNPNLPDRRVFERAVVPSFFGVLDGDGHVVSNLHIEGRDTVGFFGILGEEAVVANLGLEAIDVYGTGDNVGGLAGKSSGNIMSCYCNGSVAGNNSVGGLVGYWGYWSSVALSYSAGTVSGRSRVGGLVGHIRYGSITSSYSTCSVIGSSNVGGLVGDNTGYVISCYSTGPVSGSSRVGGLVGNGLYGDVTSSFWDIETSGKGKSYGGTGLDTVQMYDANTYLNEGWDFVDEIPNGTSDFWQIQNGSYPTLAGFSEVSRDAPKGTGTLDDPYLLTDAYDLGAMWYHPLAHYRLVADIDLSGMTWGMAVIPYFTGSLEGDDHVISNLHIRGGHYLGLFARTGSRAKVSNLNLEAVDVNGRRYPAGSGGWNTGTCAAGLAAWNQGRISSCSSNGCVVGYLDVGGLVGVNWIGGIITSSCSVGLITGDRRVGGLVGDNAGVIKASYSTCSVTGGEDVGGLVGTAGGHVTSCYSTGPVSGSSRVGGLAGGNYHGNITSSYSSGLVNKTSPSGGFVGFNLGGSVMTSFWDMETSGHTTSDGGTGKTTNEMQTASTFLEAGWDFVDEMENGIEDIWWIDEGQDYPRLWFELIPKN